MKRPRTGAAVRDTTRERQTDGRLPLNPTVRRAALESGTLALTLSAITTELTVDGSDDEQGAWTARCKHAASFSLHRPFWLAPPSDDAPVSYRVYRPFDGRAAPATAIPIIDTHIHLFDPTRPQGAPYSGPGGAATAATLPAAAYRRLAAPLGIVGAIKIEASPWIEDNLWVLEVAERDTIVVGVVGNLEPDKPDLPRCSARYHKNPLFRGIRYGNLWGRDITAQANNPAFIDGLKLLAQADLVLDTANPRVDLLQAIVKITDRIPDLRVVIDHLPSLDPTPGSRPA